MVDEKLELVIRADFWVNSKIFMNILLPSSPTDDAFISLKLDVLLLVGSFMISLRRVH